MPDPTIRSGVAETVDVTLRIHPRNLASLLHEHHPVEAVWLVEEEPGVYALKATIPIGFEASRDLPNLEPGNVLEGMSAEQKRAVGEAWEADHDRT